MIRNYLLIAARTLTRQFLYSTINILGLAIGIACSLVIFLYVYGEWSYDAHVKRADHIYKIGISFYNIGQFGFGPEVMGEYLPHDFDGVEAFTRIRNPGHVQLRTEGQSFDDLAYYTDSLFFHVFAHKFILGDARTALKGPGKAVMTERMAHKFFKDEPPLGKVLEIGKERKPFTVTAIVEDDDRSSQLKSSLWLSIDDVLTHDTNWTSAETYNYVLLKENNTRADLDVALDRLLEKRVYPASGAEKNKTSFAEYKKSENSVKFFVHALRDVHLKSKLNFEISPGGNETNIAIFAGVSAFILLLAIVNFINLATARASRRAKEVGIRKAIGSSRGKLITQFTLESIMVSLIAVALSAALAELFLRGFEFITGTPLITTLWSSGWSLPLLLAFGIVVGFMAGIYPAFYLTAFNPVKVLKGNRGAGRSGGFRDFLVTFQFSISICLMICSAVVLQQVQFMQTKDLGFRQDNVVTLDNIGLLKTQADAFKNELLRYAGVSLGSLHTGEPGYKNIMVFNTYQTPLLQDAVTINTYFGDEHYVDLMGFHLLKGRNFDRNLASDTSSVILNEAAVKVLGLTDPIGAPLNKTQRVIGVVTDFHWESLRTSIAPVALLLAKNYEQLGVRLDPGAATAFLQRAETKWKSMVTDEPFRYHFLDQNFGELLKKEKVFSKAIVFFTALAIFISCLGLYGLSAYTAEQRTKEIGIRKVLGATTSTLVRMLNRKFAVLMIVAVVVAVPVSAYAMVRWLEGFAYKADLQAWVFLSAIALTFILAVLTVSVHSLKAAWINPAETLKYE
jgi:putative ABC transport system permease protein